MYLAWKHVMSGIRKPAISRNALFILTYMLLFCMLVSCSRPMGADHDSPSVAETGDPAMYKDTLDAFYKLLHLNPSETRDVMMQMLDSVGDTSIWVEVELLRHIGTSYLHEQNFAESMRYYTYALAKADSVNSRGQYAAINNNMGVINRRVGNLKTALTQFNEASNSFAILGDQRRQQGTYINKGLIYLNLDNFDKAQYYFEQAHDGFYSSNDTIGILAALNNMALVHKYKGDYDHALDKLKFAIRLAEKTQNRYSMSISKQSLGGVYFSAGDKENAVKAFLESKSMSDETNQPYRSAQAQLGIANVFFESGEPLEALKIGKEVMDLALAHENENLQGEAHKLLSNAYEAIGEHKKGLKHYRLHISLNEDMLKQTNIHTVYDFELTNLSQANKLQQLELERKELTISKKNNMLWFAILLFVFSVLGLYLLYLNYRNRQRVKLQQAMLLLSKKKSHAAVAAEIQERKRIGQELHDRLGQLLSVAGLHISVLQKKKDLPQVRKDELLASAMKSVDYAFSEVRNISHNLAPSLLSERGLKGALKNLSDQVNQSSQLHMSFDTHGMGAKLNSVIENALFRAIQEILNNAIKHSSADRLSFQLIQSATDITLMAEDNGCGFNPENLAINVGYGLAQMKTRTENLNGSMHIDSSSERGTTICIVIPLNSVSNVRKSYQSIGG